MNNNYVSIEKMKYKRDSLSYSLALIGLVINVLYFFTLYRNNANFYYDIKIGISIIYNLLFMLIVFLAAENIKNYRLSYSIVLVIIGLMQFVRILIYPSLALKEGVLSNKDFLYIIIYLSLSGAFLLTSSIISIIKSITLKRFVDGKIKFDQTE